MGFGLTESTSGIKKYDLVSGVGWLGGIDIGMVDGS